MKTGENKADRAKEKTVFRNNCGFFSCPQSCN